MKKIALFWALGVVTLTITACNTTQSTLQSELASEQIEATEATLSVKEREEEQEQAREKAFLADLESVLIDDLTEVEIKGWNFWEGIKYPLIAAIPDEEIYMYGYNGDFSYNQGVVFQIGSGADEQLLTFPWYYVSRDHLPELFWIDIDMDGSNELICIAHTGAGTGISIDDLYILQLTDEKTYEAFTFEWEDYCKQLEDLITFDYDIETNIMTIYAGETQSEEEIYWFDEYLADDGILEVPSRLVFGNIIYFSYEDDILRITAPAMPISDSVSTLYTYTDALITAEVRFEDGQFLLENPSVSIPDYLW